MAERTESSIRVAAGCAAVLAVIADVPAYPEWTGAVRAAEVLSRDDEGRPATARFTLDAGAIRDTYTLAYTWATGADGVGTVSWRLLEATVLRAMDGSYELRPQGEGETLVTYRLTVDLRVPMLGLLRRKAEKVIIDTALNELKKRVEG